jgi:cytochrome c oxidase assembly protein subunit 11
MQASPAQHRKHRRVAAIFGCVAIAMVGASYAAVPLYKIFCQHTGFGGTTQRAEGPSTVRGQRVMTVRFDANVGSGLPWSFAPEQPATSVRTGETATVFFKVHNNSQQTWAGTAAYNVSPDQSGSYFVKIACFCFSEQHLAPGETAEWPVVFYLDPDLEKDETMKGVGAVTLSYTFFPSKVQPATVAAADSGPMTVR